MKEAPPDRLLPSRDSDAAGFGAAAHRAAAAAGRPGAPRIFSATSSNGAIRVEDPMTDARALHPITRVHVVEQRWHEQLAAWRCWRRWRRPPRRCCTCHLCSACRSAADTALATEQPRTEDAVAWLSLSDSSSQRRRRPRAEQAVHCQPQTDATATHCAWHVLGDAGARRLMGGGRDARSARSTEPRTAVAATTLRSARVAARTARPGRRARR